MLRKIVSIDQDKCDGCGECATACAEGAIQIIDGKAQLVSESYCDGLGACLGECPQGAITIEEREASAFDEQAVAHHIAHLAERSLAAATRGHRDELPCQCPGSLSRSLREEKPAAHAAHAANAEPTPSALGNWPVQMRLVPVNAPYFEGARLLIAADCVPFALADFHRLLLDGRVLLIGCPKLDEAEFYHAKLAQIFHDNDLRSVEIAYMEVPCCFGLVRLVQMALEDSGKDLPLTLVKIGVRGEMLADEAQIAPARTRRA